MPQGSRGQKSSPAQNAGDAKQNLLQGMEDRFFTVNQRSVDIKYNLFIFYFYLLAGNK